MRSPLLPVSLLPKKRTWIEGFSPPWHVPSRQLLCISPRIRYYPYQRSNGVMEISIYNRSVAPKIQPPPPSPLTHTRGRPNRPLLHSSILLPPRLPRNRKIPHRNRTNRSRRAITRLRHNRQKQSPLVPGPERTTRLQKLRPHGHPFLLQLLFCRPIQLPPLNPPSNGLHINQRPRPLRTTIPSLIPLLRSSSIPVRPTC